MDTRMLCWYSEHGKESSTVSMCFVQLMIKRVGENLNTHVSFCNNFHSSVFPFVFVMNSWNCKETLWTPCIVNHEWSDTFKLLNFYNNDDHFEPDLYYYLITDYTKWSSLSRMLSSKFPQMSMYQFFHLNTSLDFMQYKEGKMKKLRTF